MFSKIKGLFTKITGKEKEFVSRFDIRQEKQEELEKQIHVRYRLEAPYPTNYLPTLRLKMSSLFRHYEFQAEKRRLERESRKERDIELSMYSILYTYIETEVEKRRTDYIKSGGETGGISLIQIDSKFNRVLGKVISQLEAQDRVTLIAMNSNYKKWSEKQESEGKTNKLPPTLILIELNEYIQDKNRLELRGAM